MANSPIIHSSTKYFVIAGERSGDLHASNLIKAIKKADDHAIIQAWGGDLMQAAGAEILKHYRALAFMGLVEVIQNLPKIIGFIGECKKQIMAFQPDAIILVDYAGFNMRIAQWAKTKGYKVFYYISPKVWAWNQNRALKIKANVDKLFVIFPFEVAFFKRFDYAVEYVGNPLFDAIEQFQKNEAFLQKNNLGSRKIIALLPGSRQQEIKQCLQKMIAVSHEFPEFDFVVAGVSNLAIDSYTPFVGNNVKLIIDQTYDLLSYAHAAVVSSGTASLETALFEVPQVVVYAVNPVTYFIGKQLVKVKYMSLVNLIADKLVVPELLQADFSIKKTVATLKLISEKGVYRTTQLEAYQTLKSSMGSAGASEKAGNRIIELTKQKKYGT